MYMNIQKITPGYIAFFLGLFAIVPQFYKLVITHDIGSFSLIFIILSISSQILWVCQGLFVTKDRSQFLQATIVVLFYSYILYLYISQKITKTKHQKKDGNEIGHI